MKKFQYIVKLYQKSTQMALLDRLSFLGHQKIYIIINILMNQC